MFGKLRVGKLYLSANGSLRYSIEIAVFTYMYAASNVNTFPSFPYVI